MVIPYPYAWIPSGQKLSPRHRGRRKTHFLVQTSTVFGADVHDRDSTNGAFVKRGVWSVTDFFPVIACVPATLKLRGTGMSLVSLSRHPPPSQRLILPSGQTLVHSSDHLSCPNQEPAWHSNTDGRLEVASFRRHPCGPSRQPVQMCRQTSTQFCLI